MVFGEGCCVVVVWWSALLMLIICTSIYYTHAPHVDQGDVQMAVLEVGDEPARVRRAQRDPGVAVVCLFVWVCVCE